MNDPYRISDAPPAGRPPAHPSGEPDGRGGLLRPALWVLLVLSAAANAISSSIGVNPFIAGGFGVVTLACVAALIVHHYRHRQV